MNLNNNTSASQLLPGQPLRIGVDLIADKKSGALIVIGTTTKLEKISSGGLNLNDCEFSPEMLSELSKMDGAIVVNESVTKILKANVHLNPSDSISTTQTGTRHRTAERTSASTGLTVIAVSEETALIKVFENLQTIELEESSAILGRVNESLQSVDRMRRRFDDAVTNLGELEIENTLTNYKLLNKNKGICSILFNPQTGKTHQLRIVSKNLGCPIVGDQKYNIHSKYSKEKLMLHAIVLKFEVNTKKFEFISKLPDHFLSFVKKNNIKISKDLKEYLNSF